MAGLPRAGQTRILASRIRESAAAVQWEWTIVGDRNWRACRVAGTTFTLSDSYPLNSVSATGGTQMWLLDLSVTREKSAAGSVARYAVSMRGSTAETASLSGSLPLEGSNVNSVVRIAAEGDSTVSVPARITIAQLGRQRVELRVQQ